MWFIRVASFICIFKLELDKMKSNGDKCADFLLPKLYNQSNLANL